MSAPNAEGGAEEDGAAPRARASATLQMAAGLLAFTYACAAFW